MSKNPKKRVRVEIPVGNKTKDCYRTKVKMLAVAPSATKYENAGVFALNKAPLFCGVDSESCTGDDVSTAGGAEVEVAAGTSTDVSAEDVGSDANVSESDSGTAPGITSMHAKRGHPRFAACVSTVGVAEESRKSEARKKKRAKVDNLEDIVCQIVRTGLKSRTMTR